MGTIWTANLTNAEIERYAYLYGKQHLASLAAEVEDQEDLEERHEQELESAEEKAFDNDQTIEDLDAEIDRLKSDYQRCRNNLQAVSDWFRVNDNHNTLVKRKAYADKVRRALNATPRH